MFTGIDAIISSKHLSGEAFFLTSTASGPVIWSVLLEPTVEKELTKAFADKLRKVAVEPNVGKAGVPMVSTILERDRQVMEYDQAAIGHVPSEFAEIQRVLTFGVNASAPAFDFKQQGLSAVKGVIYHLSDGQGNSVVIYQHKYPVSLHKKTKSSFCSFNGRTLGKVDYDAIDINDTVDVFYFAGKFYTLNVALLERFYGLEQVINNLAHAATPLVLALNVINIQGVASPGDIFKDMHHDRAFMRRLAMVSKGNIVKSGLNVTQIQGVMANFPIFSRTIDLTGGLVNLTTKEQKRSFIRLLNNEASFAALDNSPFLAVDKDSAA
ncbi:MULTISPECIES: Kiwa anti-phage protein KwaB-like domain-containing protein [unclassified Pseudomonas]|uniref:Kiwa anti-phage protein KwaB-like domain-containing protein n=1 Tax=unclassified Pseudomonas TaxID=196821 RepID=UPI001A9D37B8|nr:MULTISPECIES: Kiwa anti-phage protein KwaB-like domain-containing protein [unclassified Pseudomonas]